MSETNTIEDSFPFELLPAIKELRIGGLGMQGYGCRGGSALLVGLAAMEMSRVDSSIATFFGVHSGLAMGSIYAAGSEAQKEKRLPPMARCEKIGCFGLTEPLVGSGASRGLMTTAKREGDTWVLNGQKKWIGNSPWCDLSVIWARDVNDNQVKGFIVENKTKPGFSVEKIQNKIALKVVQNGLITLKDVRVPEENHLQEGKSFRDTARVLRMTRYLVAWEATGCQMEAYEHAVKYAQERLQFGRPIGSFQLIQDAEPDRRQGHHRLQRLRVIRYASLAVETAKFGQPEVAIGVISGYGGTQRLPRLVGKGRALQMILTGEMIGAQDAHRIGLVNEVVAKDDLIPRAEAIIPKIAVNAPIAVKLAMEAVNRGLDTTLGEGLEIEATLFARCTATEDMKEGVAAFRDKRQPSFQGQ